LEDDEHTCQPRTTRTEHKIKEDFIYVHTKRFQVLDEVRAATEISHGTSGTVISNDLNMSHIAQDSVSCVLMQDQHDNHMNIWQDLIDKSKVISVTGRGGL
jgi:hypothetical protein